MPDSADVGSTVSSVTSQTEGVTEIITGASEAAGAAMEVASIEKFKAHKDNPTQMPL